MRTLVIGCDASGKSTLLAGIHQQYGDIVRESTHSAEALAFKQANANRYIDADFIAEREAFYLQIEQQERDATKYTTDIATTNATLVTRVSHDVMRRCIGGEGLGDSEIIARWIEDEQGSDIAKPDIIAYTHASFETIYARIIERQNAGMREERFWGFNSPLFLEAYQERWRTLILPLAQLGFRCVSIDTDKLTRENMLESYRLARLEALNAES